MRYVTLMHANLAPKNPPYIVSPDVVVTLQRRPGGLLALPQAGSLCLHESWQELMTSQCSMWLQMPSSFFRGPCHNLHMPPASPLPTVLR